MNEDDGAIEESESCGREALFEAQGRADLRRELKRLWSGHRARQPFTPLVSPRKHAEQLGYI